MTTDKTGAPTTVTQESDRFSISVDGQKVGFTEYVDRDGQRIFPHTEVSNEYEGRGLATILVNEALQTTRDSVPGYARPYGSGRTTRTCRSGIAMVPF